MYGIIASHTRQLTTYAAYLVYMLFPCMEYSLSGTTVGTSGQPISDIARQRRDTITPSTAECLVEKQSGLDIPVDDQSSLDILEDTLKWGHVAPTCPGRMLVGCLW